MKLATKHLCTKQCFDSKFSEDNQESNFWLVFGPFANTVTPHTETKAENHWTRIVLDLM